VAGGFTRAFDRAADLDCCHAVQIFVKNANQWRAKPLADEEAAAFRAARAVHAAGGALMAHASYLINPAAVDPRVLTPSLTALADEIERCDRLGVDALVLHPGAHLGDGEEAGIGRAAAMLDQTLAALPDAATRILLENTAGQGTCLGHRLEHLAAIRSALRAPRALERVGICIDTCHAFAAGYAIHEAAGWRNFVAEIEARFGIAALGLIHLNDSLRPFGSRRDRHAHIGEGQIGLDAFARMLAEPALARVPMILETEPGDEMVGHRRDLDLLRQLWRGLQQEDGGSLTTPRAAGRGGTSSRRSKKPPP
jgi:deoxyribonuclease-4